MRYDQGRHEFTQGLKKPCQPLRSLLPFAIFLVAQSLFITLAVLQDSLLIVILGFVIAFLLAQSIKVAQQWEKALILRLGKFYKLEGPGLFLTIPIIDTVPYWIDQRTVATPFNAEQTLTKDNVPVDVDAILFWVVWDPEKAALEVENYKDAVSWAAQTALRDIIGKTMLSDMLAGREHIDQQLQEVIDRRTAPWGVAVQSVEIRDVIIPEALQDAMSREAQAERERKARVILSSAEVEVAAKFAEAAQVYEGNGVALQLRAMNILYEGLKEKGGIVVVPSQISDAVNIGTLLGLANQQAVTKEKKENIKGE